MKKIAALLLFLLATNLLSAQNLVFNGSFEVYQTCPKYQSQITLSGGWFRPTDGTPDYFNECCGISKIGVPDNFVGSQKPRSGNAYAGFYLYQSDAPDNYREYLSTELKTPLQKGKEYYVKFYVSLAKLSECAIGNIGVLFSEEVNKTGDASRIILKPQLNYNTKVIADSGRWVELLWTYKAKGNEKFMTIGNFDKAEKCNIKYLITPGKDIPLRSYYYIDDVCVEEVVDGQPCRCIQDTNDLAQHADRMKITRDSSVKAKVPPTKVIKPEQNVLLENILFETDKADLQPGAYKELDQIADYLYYNPTTVVEIDGYTDNTGIDNKNLILSRERSKAVANYIIKRGIDTSRLKPKGYGPADPIGNNLRPEGRAKNRRVDYKIHIAPWRHKEKIYKTEVLKSGYTLIYKKYDSINYLCLRKDFIENEVSEHESDTALPLDVLGYVYRDFDSVFVIATHLQANPIKIEIINKRTGGTIMYGATPFYMDTVKNIMMFEGTYRRGGKLILYDFNTGKSELYNAPKETHCFCCYCWKVLSLTDSEIKIEYLNMKDEPTVITYSRK
ncbi:MAG TPA: OmpA family protein [Bacteroidia bacterium]|jgi:OOP family OmpA-OmpF porin|nr:OmpA family protein [Bacteroidia bacterium]